MTVRSYHSALSPPRGMSEEVWSRLLVCAEVCPVTRAWLDVWRDGKQPLVTVLAEAVLTLSADREFMLKKIAELLEHKPMPPIAAPRDR